MEDILMEILKDRVDEKVRTAVDAAVADTVAADAAATAAAVADAADAERQKTTVLYIKDIMTKLKYTAEQAMDLLSIPQSQRSTYAGLVGKTGC